MTELATFNVLASTGTVGASETQAWAPVAVTKDGTDYLTGKYWPLTDQSYHFYASNASLTFGATGSTVTADGSTDIVVAYLPSPSFKEKNTLTFNHIYARVGNFTLNTQSGYTLSGVSATLKDGVSGGTYNIFSGNGQTDGTGWSGLSAASDRALGAFSSSTTAPVSSNDLWLVPGDYTISVTYTLNKGDYSEQFTKTGTVSLVAGKTNTITATAVGGSASEIKFGVSVTAWSANAIVMEFAPTFGGLEISSGPLYYNGTSYELKDNWNYISHITAHEAGACFHSINDDNGIFGLFDSTDLGEFGEYDSAYDYFDAGNSIQNDKKPFGEWRLPSRAEYDVIIGTTRQGSTVNGVSGVHYALVEVTDVGNIIGLLVFPDGKTITGVSFTGKMDNSGSGSTSLTNSQLENYLSQGCAFFPCSGSYDDGGCEWWSEVGFYHTSDCVTILCDPGDYAWEMVAVNAFVFDNLGNIILPGDDNRGWFSIYDAYGAIRLVR